MNDKPTMGDAKAFDPVARGWEIINNTPFGDLVGPIWKHETPERLRWGFVVEPKASQPRRQPAWRHADDLRRSDHGVDGAQATDDKRHATIELNIQFVGAVQLGQFVEAHAEVVRATRSVMFMGVTMYVGDRVVASASGIWKILEE